MAHSSPGLARPPAHLLARAKRAAGGEMPAGHRTLRRSQRAVHSCSRSCRSPGAAGRPPRCGSLSRSVRVTTATENMCFRRSRVTSANVAMCRDNWIDEAVVRVSSPVTGSQHHHDTTSPPRRDATPRRSRFVPPPRRADDVTPYCRRRVVARVSRLRQSPIRGSRSAISHHGRRWSGRQARMTHERRGLVGRDWSVRC